MRFSAEQLTIPRTELRFEFARSGGPGGQNVNKVESKATLRWRPADNNSLPDEVRDRLLGLVGPFLTNQGELLISSQRTRDQQRNIADCIVKLQKLILAASRPPKVRRPTRPTLASRVRRVETKTKRAVTKRLRRKPDLD